MHTQQTI